MPDGCTDLLWRRGALEIAGPDTRHREVPLEPGELIVGVRLRPGAARLLLGGVPATDVTDAQPGLGELWGEAALRLSDTLEGVREPWRIAAVLAGALGDRMGVHGPDRVAVAVAASLDRPRPPAIAGLAWELGFSERHLRRRVRAAAGYGPKTLEQILRFRRALEAASSAAAGSGVAGLEAVSSGPTRSAEPGRTPGLGPKRGGTPDRASVRTRSAGPAWTSGPDWSRIAAEQGYADQAHLSRQVRRWAGATPGAIVARATPSRGHGADDGTVRLRRADETRARSRSRRVARTHEVGASRAFTVPASPPRA
ncbi:DUF6597 domain-containing transcriptional factor [Glycomyces sp. NPDC021274]|uniref:DUF6597 domain-containing transcriptional factor n=1 Tax=Glycomyces sp. NPDC021274 TaxID=3155120 RepID=UPI0033E730A4